MGRGEATSSRLTRSAGAGANTFEVARKRYRDLASSVTQPHSVPLQFLAGTGLVGLALLLGLVAAAAAAAVGAVRRLEGTERDAAAALAVALALWLVHALVDYDWDFVAVTGPAFFAVGALAAAGRPARAGAFPVAAAAAAAVALASVVAIVTPWLADQSVRDVDPALDRGAIAQAAMPPGRARSLDPLALEPLFARARVEEAPATRTPRSAPTASGALQPENPERLARARPLRVRPRRPLRGLRPPEPGLHARPGRHAVGTDGELDQARAWVNAGNC